MHLKTLRLASLILVGALSTQAIAVANPDLQGLPALRHETWVATS
jgi:hypothetical protein